MARKGPSLEEQLGSREAFEAHQKSEAERTARVLERKRQAFREGWAHLGWTMLKSLLAIAAIAVAYHLLG